MMMQLQAEVAKLSFDHSKMYQAYGQALLAEKELRTENERLKNQLRRCPNPEG